MQVPPPTSLGDPTGSLAGTRGRAALLAAATEANSARLGERTAPTSAQISAAVRAHDDTPPPGPHTTSAIMLARRLPRSAGMIDRDMVVAGPQAAGPDPRTAVVAENDSVAGTSRRPARRYAHVNGDGDGLG
ncbi:hypothetical protein KIF24_24685 [Micromonospora sp. Llam7]|uniref:hypothetical protein n=1 Tax=Micromonospora tarapacensis TaxID=2835305 RepID=UPI001C83F908|nr:hypothetical protein [Micromonospora tarapacensis]MBX7268911.1 hypothetical protein [Micromonospora tarapacensis]